MFEIETRSGLGCDEPSLGPGPGGLVWFLSNFPRQVGTCSLGCFSPLACTRSVCLFALGPFVRLSAAPCVRVVHEPAARLSVSPFSCLCVSFPFRTRWARRRPRDFIDCTLAAAVAANTKARVNTRTNSPAHLMVGLRERQQRQGSQPRNFATRTLARVRAVCAKSGPGPRERNCAFSGGTGSTAQTLCPGGEASRAPG
ncbi:Hypothetical predicted protein [Olea europaea subsp. europaea]|uniref:Uncharacterized protein n=1 Tax=Olea europaea subsp. europaea TaxID=158383 RepID=A0A8S0TKM2_OLEEU|nr:Hypothetical predicted protein [Olea europaea subsp. europaea]